MTGVSLEGGPGKFGILMLLVRDRYPAEGAAPVLERLWDEKGFEARWEDMEGLMQEGRKGGRAEGRRVGEMVMEGLGEGDEGEDEYVRRPPDLAGYAPSHPSPRIWIDDTTFFLSYSIPELVETEDLPNESENARYVHFVHAKHLTGS